MNGEIAVIVQYVALIALAAVAALVMDNAQYKRVGGLHFWRFGRLGFSCYLSRRAPSRSWAE
jgi:hypothetical protein